MPVGRYIILLLLIHFAVILGAQEPEQVVLLRETALKYGQAEVITPFTSREAANQISKKFSVSTFRDGNLHIIVNALEINRFLESGIHFKVIRSDPPKAILSSSTLVEAMEWNSYPKYTQYDSIMHKFAADYPQLCTVDTIGTSIYGKLVLVLKISDNVIIDEDEPEVFYSSTIHGDETGGFVLMLRLADYLLKNYNTNPLARRLIENLEIYINPLANPDGTYRTGNIISSPVRANASGRDLNRNFPDPLDPGDIIEKENRDMIKFLRERNFVISANFHAGEEVVNFPWDRWERLHADDEWFYHISREYADTLHLFSPGTYFDGFDNGVTNGYAWYWITGGRQDYVTWELQGREVTIELDDTKTTPVSQLEQLWQYNYRSLLRYIENALFGIHGFVNDIHNSNPVPAKIFIPGHDKDSSHVYADSLTGSFVRMLSPGLWDLKFSAPGYYDTTATVSVSDRLKTDLFVMMRPINQVVDTVDTDVPIIWPNPSHGNITVVLPPGLSGTIDISIVTVAGKIAKKIPLEVIAGLSYDLTLDDIGSGYFIIVFTNRATGYRVSSGIVLAGSH